MTRLVEPLLFLCPSECDISIHQLVSEKQLGQCTEKKQVHRFLRQGDSIQFISNRMKSQCVKVRHDSNFLSRSSSVFDSSVLPFLFQALIAAAWMNQKSLADVESAIHRLGLLHK